MFKMNLISSGAQISITIHSGIRLARADASHGLGTVLGFLIDYTWWKVLTWPWTHMTHVRKRSTLAIYIFIYIYSLGFQSQNRMRYMRLLYHPYSRTIKYFS